MKIEDEIEVRTAVENNEYVANSYVKELLGALDEARARLAVSEKSELALLRQSDSIRDAVRNLRVMRSSCADSHNGDFRVHLCEREWDALVEMYDKLDGARDAAETDYRGGKYTCEVTAHPLNGGGGNAKPLVYSTEKA